MLMMCECGETFEVSPSAEKVESKCPMCRQLVTCNCGETFMADDEITKCPACKAHGQYYREVDDANR